MPNARVKFLRDNATHTEKLLWAQLRRKRVDERRFRRQFPIGDYIVDFVCLSAKLIIEIDGASHDQTFARDERRTAWLASQGFRVVRFSNAEVLENLEGVVRSIEVELRSDRRAPSP